MDEFSLAHGAGDFGEGVEGWIEEVRVVGGEFVFPGFDAESAVELLLEGAELVPGAGEIGTVFHRMLENETGQEADGEVVGGGREGDSQRQREIGVGCGVEIDKKAVAARRRAVTMLRVRGRFLVCFMGASPFFNLSF